MTQVKSQTDLQDIKRIVDYLNGLEISLPQPVSEPDDVPPVAAAQSTAAIVKELSALPQDQLLHTHRQFEVWYGGAWQLPITLREITRLRELTFRDMQEGSGEPVDTDRFDAHYVHLFVWDTKEQAIVGGYRLGRTDELIREFGAEGVYLGIMFDFDSEFYGDEPMLEIGRSFVTPAYQRTHSSLYLLWCGIGRYLMKFPQYRRVYGVVSMSRLYDGRAIAAIRDALLEPGEGVTAKAAYEPDLGAQWREFLSSKKPLAMQEVSQIVRALEGDERDVPVLIRHYHKLGARFVSAAVDGNFNNTPGLLLNLDVPSIPAKYLKQYFGEGVEDYLRFKL